MANTKVTGDLIASSTIATGNIADNAVTSDKINGITTAHITEGSNLYYTDARARGAVSVGGNALSYDSSTGVITSNFEESPTFTGEVSLKSRLNLQRSSGGATTLIQFKNENGVDRAHIDFGGTNEELSFFSGSGGSEHMRVTSAGNVGIGKSPQSDARLHTYRNSTDAYNIFESSANKWVFGEAGGVCQVGGRYGHHSGILIDTSGNVGIGTASPESGAKLDVRAGSGGKIVLGSYDANYKIVVEGGDQLNFYNGTSAATAYVNYGATGTPGNVLVSRNLFVEANSSGGVNGTIRIKSDGKVGIGVTSPDAQLDIHSSGSWGQYGRGSGGEINVENTNTSVNEGGWIGIAGYTGNTANNGFYPMAGITAKKSTASGDGNYGGDLSFWTTAGTGQSPEANSGMYQRMTINRSGKVGIGTDSPVNPLHIKAPNGGMMRIENSSGQIGAYTEFSGGYAYQYYYELGGSVKIALQTNGDSYFNGGNVGIGTTLPSVKLQVQQDQTAESNVIFMNNSTGANAAIRLSLNVGNPAGDDPKISFNVGDGGLDWTMGVDNSDSDKFKISGGTDSHNPNLGTNDRLVIDASGRVEVAGNVLSIDTVDEYREDFTTTGSSTPSFDIDLKSIGASGQPFEVFVAWTHYSTSHGAGLHQAYYQRSTIQSDITLIHTYFNQTSSNAGAWSVVWLTGTEIRVQKSSGTHGSNGYGYIRVTRLKP